jgi:transcriptional regulator with XRE-family HTH domain
MSESSLFPERLKTARDLRELSQAELAERAGLQASAVSHFETGSRKPSFDNLRRLADALDVTTDYLLGRTKEPMAVVGADRLHRHIAKLSASDQQMAEQFIEMLAKKGRK